jgi:putative ABC transport system ATP-binding protein
MATPLIQIDSLVKQYTRDTQVLTVLDKISLSVEEGDFVALMGPSGSGKTTLLNLIAGIDRPTSGRILVGDAEVSKMSEGALAKWRSANVGFIFQLYNLVPVLTAFENVELPLLLTSLNRARRRKQVELALSVVGLADRMDHYPRQLSGGQEQRVAIARAIATDPKVLVADEPTGDLDSKAGEEILILMERLNAEFKKTIVMVTHDPKAAGRAHRLVHLDKGVLKEDVHAERGKAVGMAAAISASAT